MKEDSAANSTPDLPLGEKKCIDEPPTKKRRLEHKKPESPPWKKVIADGPSSFTQEGKRRSGRVNSIPLELQSQPPSEKKSTRATQKLTPKNARGCTKYDKSIKSSSKILQNASDSPPPPPRNIPQNLGSLTTVSRPKVSTKISPLRRSNRKSLTIDQKPSPVSVHRDSQPLKNPSTASNVSRIARATNFKLGEVKNQNPANKARIRLRIKPPSLPVTHPGLVIPRPKQYSSLQEYLKHAAEKHISDGGLFHPEVFSDYPPNGALEDARIILRAEKATEVDGTLAFGNYNFYHGVDDPQQFPPQYSHLDHMCKAAVGFRKLMLMEQKNHKQLAKRLAEACLDEWCRRQPKTTEQLQAELIVASQLRYRNVVKTLQATWDNVKAEVNRQRLLVWEAEEQARVRKALSEAVDKSQQKLQERKAYMETGIISDEYESELEGTSHADDEIGSRLEYNDVNSIVSEVSEADGDNSAENSGEEDDKLTVEQLRAKYSVLPALNTHSLNEEITDFDASNSRESRNETFSETIPNHDDSDTSIDMDDDLGASDEDRNNSMEEEEDNEEFGDTSLLGFLTRSELKAVGFSGETKSVKDVPQKSEAKTSEVESSHVLCDGNKNSFDNIQDFSENIQNKKNQPKISDCGLFVKKDVSSPSAQVVLGDSVMKDPISPLQPTSITKECESPGPRCQPTPLTAENCPSENESTFSHEFDQSKPKDTQSTTPQPDYQIKTLVPFLLRGTLREYQHYGLDWLAGLYANNTNGILADEMGLGKTIQTISLLAHLACVHEEWGPHLVIVPTSVILNWEMEFKKWCPGLKILTYYGSIEERKKKRAGWKNKDMWNVCITSYQLVIRDQQVFKRRRWHYMILDEAHNIKNFNSQRWQTMLTFNTRARLLLTGTPLQNNLTELWSLLYFLMPSDGTNQGVGGFADLKEFQDWFKKPSDQILEHGREQMDTESWAIISKLHKILRPYLLRRLKADVEKQLPAKYEHVEYCRLSKRQRELYDGFLSRNDTREVLASGNNLSIINCLMQLRKVCNHPDLFIDRPISTSLPMEKSAVADFEIKEFLVRRRLLQQDPMTIPSLDFLNLVPTKYEMFSDSIASRAAVLSAQRILIETREAQRLRAQNSFTNFDPTTVKSNLAYLESSYRWGRFEELQHCVYINALRRQQKPIYGSQLVELLTLGVTQHYPQPKGRDPIMIWLENNSPVMKELIKPLSIRAENFKSTIQRFACLTPAVIAKDITSFTLTPRGIAMLQEQIDPSEVDPFHEARMRLSIQFPDKRLLQYDCGKLQALDKLLRKLQPQGHRALIFTQMTKVLDILEQFLNIHGHKYLRLDGSTKIEQRQALTDRFNHDTRILAFILSSRSGGLGINLTGADTVIFYDLDWNPAMDKQCQDRCHRIGQTRDVHIYRLISEHTIEANILRKANQKRMLDDVVIQEGDFTTDYFNKISVREMIDQSSLLLDGDAAANAAMDRVLGGSGHREVPHHVLAQAEDHEDVLAARLAEHEIVQTDAADFDENLTHSNENNGDDDPVDPLFVEEDMKEVHNSIVTTALTVDKVNCEDEVEINAWGYRIHSIDDYMLKFMKDQLKDTSLEFPKDKSKNKKGKDYRLHRPRL